MGKIIAAGGMRGQRVGHAALEVLVPKIAPLHSRQLRPVAENACVPQRQALVFNLADRLIGQENLATR